MKLSSFIKMALLSSVACTLLTGSAIAQEKIRVLIGAYQDLAAIYENAARQFEAENPGVEIELLHSGSRAFNENLAAAAMSNDLPDAVLFDAPYLANYVWSGILQPVEPHIDPDLIAEMTASNRAQSTYPIDGKLYAFGLLDSVVVLYGNKRYLDAVGARIPTSVEDAWDKQEMEDILVKLAALDEVTWPIDLFRSFGPRSEWVTYALSPIFQSFGCDLIDRKTWRATGTLDSEPCIAAGTMLQNWAKNDWLVPATSAINVFYAEGQKTALAWGARTYYAEATSAMDKDNIVVMPFANLGAGSVSPNGTWTWGITTAAKDPALTGKFLSFLARHPEHRAILRDMGETPALTSFVTESPLYAPGGPLSIAMEMAEKTAVSRPEHPAYPTITEAFKTTIDAIYSGSDVKTELEKAARAIDDEIDDNDGFPPFGESH